MRRLAAILFGVMLGGAGVWAGYNYHFVRSEKEWLFVPKQRAALADIYVDIRAWEPSDWQTHQDLMRNLMAHGRSDLILGSARGLLEEFLDQLTPRTGRSSDGLTPR